MGLAVDSILSFCDHIDQVSVRCRLSGRIFILKCLSCFHSPELLLLAYCGCFNPHITYAVLICNHECIKTQYLFRLQERAIRTVFEMNKDQFCESSFQNNRIPTFPSLYIMDSLSFLLKNYNLLLHMFNKHSPHLLSVWVRREQ